MSNARYTIFAARAVFDDRLTDGEARVIAALGTYADDEGWCFPNQSTLAKRLKKGRPFISGAIKKAVEFGYLETEPRTATGKGMVGLNYRVKLDLPRAEAEQKAEQKPVSPQDDTGGASDCNSPVSSPGNTGAGVVVGRTPVSPQDDTGYNTEVTNPSERPQSLGSDEPKDTRGQSDAYARACAAKSKAKAASKRKRTAKAAKPKRKRAEYTPEFEAIWLSWPANRRRNSDKQVAFKRYTSGVADFGAENIAAAARAYLAHKDTRKDDFRYCCLVEVFMNGKLEAAVEAVRETSAAAPSELTIDDAKRRLAAPVWRPAWGDRADPIYDAARIALQREGGRHAT